MLIKLKKKYQGGSGTWGLGRDRCGNTGCQSCKL